MSSVEELRLGLKRLGFSVLEERAVEDSGKVYSAFAAAYIGAEPETDQLYPYLGKLKPGESAVRLYGEKVLRELRGRLEGALRGRGQETPEQLRKIIGQIEARYLK